MSMPPDMPEREPGFAAPDDTGAVADLERYHAASLDRLRHARGFALAVIEPDERLSWTVAMATEDPLDVLALLAFARQRAERDFSAAAEQLRDERQQP